METKLIEIQYNQTSGADEAEAAAKARAEALEPGWTAVGVKWLWAMPGDRLSGRWVGLEVELARG